jgi:hypothetical protein
MIVEINNLLVIQSSNFDSNLNVEALRMFQHIANKNVILLLHNPDVKVPNSAYDMNSFALLACYP